MLRLYKMSFMAVTIFPEKNEPVLLPHLSNLIMNSLKLASQAAEPNSYYLLLRALFRSIGGGRFEILYNEVLPLLQTLLEQLNALLKSADKSRKDLFAELILTVPVRLSVLLPYLSYLMRPLVHALQAGSELVSQGLRTLELCVDNLTQEFLNPLFAPVIDEVMVGLWRLLRPLPFNHQHAHTTMRILGKIGGRNRKGFDPPKLEWKPVGPEALLDVKFEGKDAAIRIGPIVDVALKIIKRGDVHYRRVAYQFLKYSVACFIRQVRPSLSFSLRARKRPKLTPPLARTGPAVGRTRDDLWPRPQRAVRRDARRRLCRRGQQVHARPRTPHLCVRARQGAAREPRPGAPVDAALVSLRRRRHRKPVHG